MLSGWLAPFLQRPCLAASASLLSLRRSSRNLVWHPCKTSSDRNLMLQPTIAFSLALMWLLRPIAAPSHRISGRCCKAGLGIGSGSHAFRIWEYLVGVHGQRSGSNLAPGEAQTLRLSLSTSTSYSSSSTLKNSATAFFSSLARCGLSMKRTVPSFSPGFEPPLAVGEVMSLKVPSRGLVMGVRVFLAFDSMVPFAVLVPLVTDLFLSLWKWRGY